jgi:effector-binding domain-containing protein
MTYEIKLLELPDQHVLTMRTVTAVENLPAFLGKAYKAVMDHMVSLGDNPTGMPFCAYYNMDMKALDVEAGFPIAKALPEKGEVKSTVIPGGKFVSTIHRGPYDSVGPAYDALLEWAEAQGYEPTGVAYEYYLNDPNADPSIVAETEIRYPLK